eukprot:TRINITY_DN853_c0_g2_i1.p1 TRINITY_DN853_c0_g2~~TRINITY_DN853_c0_g2_i1.p1  ORF type:complete len:328 (+),score=81.37 TRINITY_DN853_c0_g2_i1:205-1188(+)
MSSLFAPFDANPAEYVVYAATFTIAIALGLVLKRTFGPRQAHEMKKKELFSSHVHPHGELAKYHDQLHVVAGSLPRMGLPRNCVCYRLMSGGLLIHSAVALEERQMEKLESFGEPALLVVPNAFHRSDAAVYKERYPALKVLCPREATQKVADVVSVDGACEDVLPSFGIHTITPQPASLSSSIVELMYLLPLVREAGKEEGDGEKEEVDDDDDNLDYALVMTDTMFNLIDPPKDLISRFFSFLFGSVGPLHVTRLGRMFCHQEFLVRKCLQIIDSYDSRLKLIIVGHGDVIDKDCCASLREACVRLVGTERVDAMQEDIRSSSHRE